MKNLRNIILKNKNKRDEIVEDCIRLIDSAVMAQTGLKGFALKNAYKVGIKSHPTIIRDALLLVIDDFLLALEPYYLDFLRQKSMRSFGQYLEQRDQEVASTLLKIADAKADEVESPTILGFYRALRPQAQKHVASVVGSIGDLIERHL
jgi:hypothetical protein